MQSIVVRKQGIVAMVNKARGFAIIRDAQGIEYFAHIYKFTRQEDFDGLSKGDALTFVPYTDTSAKGNGLRAKEVERAG